MLLLAKKNMVKIFKALAFPFFFALVLFTFPTLVQAATLSIVPADGSFKTGERIPARIVVTSTPEPFNAVSAEIAFPSIFTIESVSKTNSVLNFWVTEPTISVSQGTVRFEGVALGGASTSSGTVVTVNLRATTTGTGRAAFRSGQVLANDGQGTDITKNLIGASYAITQAPVLTPPAPVSEPRPAEEVSQPLPTLNAPEIMLGTKYGAEAILGRSDYPKAQALMTFVSTDGTKIFILGSADSQGEFSVLIPRSLKRGTYAVSAVMIKLDKTNSDVSNEITVAVGNPFSDIPWWIWVFIFLLCLAVAYLLLRTYHHFGKNVHPVNHRKIMEAEDTLHKSLGILREDIETGESASDIKKDISEAERIIDKKIRDIE